MSEQTESLRAQAKARAQPAGGHTVRAYFCVCGRIVHARNHFSHEGHSEISPSTYYERVAQCEHVWEVQSMRASGRWFDTPTYPLLWVGRRPGIRARCEKCGATTGRPLVEEDE